MPQCGNADLLVDARLIRWCKAAFPVRPDGSLGADRAKKLNALAPSKDEIDRPEPDILEIVGPWPNHSWAASQNFVLIDLLEWTGSRWERRDAIVGDCVSGVEYEGNCGPFLGFGPWTQGRVIAPVIYIRGMHDPSGELVVPIQWEYAEPPRFAVGGSGSQGLPKLAPAPALYPLAFRSTATGHAILLGLSRTHNDALEIHRWEPGRLDPVIERFDDLIGVDGRVGDRPLLLTDDGATFVVAQRRAASAAPNPADRAWRAAEQPPRHDAMVLLSRAAGEWKRTTLAATWAHSMVLTPSGALWLLAGRTDSTSLVHMSAGGGVTTSALPPVTIDGKQTSVAWRGLLPVGEAALLAIGSWGRGPDEEVGLFRIEVAAPAAAKSPARGAE